MLQWMKIFKFEKWYFDILTPQNDYIFFYYTITKLLKYNISFFNLNLIPFKPSGLIDRTYNINTKLKIKKTNNNSVSTDKGEIVIDKLGCKINLTLNGIKIRLTTHPYPIQDVVWSYLTINSKNHQFIKWSPLFLKSRFSGEFVLENNTISIDNYFGYADYLFSNYFPWKVPVKTMFWGRIHHNIYDLTFAYSENQKLVQKWCKMIIRLDNYIYQMDDFIIVSKDYDYSNELGIMYPGSYKLYGKNNLITVELSSRHIKIADESTFIDLPVRLGNLQGKFLKYLSKEPKGLKFFSKAVVKINCRGSSYVFEDEFFIDEYVVFSD